ncbi:SusC/RagA family TonB-linked outer membrane protein [Algoriphagus winogradskyi]|uniref:TonB-linked outer membrane protein, SusC/RagA family n=1 Tax=Algoriphagus winogradskyi TaxID=237017 RepID=A0ABY1NT66_9BACT|nr:TonB-dependent receptor [Algoriphagus winogradskyi]SMP17309.1 TonB-linked outer membrane protein, SusC/RagA family [Algoriphagus winogradskyi]
MINKPLLLLLRMTKYTLYGFLFQMLVLNVVLAHSIKAQKIDEVYVKVSFNEEKLLNVLHEVERQTEFQFTIHENETYLNQQVSVRSNKVSVEDLLKEIGSQTGLNFQQVNRNISMWLAQDKSAATEDLTQISAISISGLVSDNTGAPLPGVTIIVEGTTSGTVSDIDGRYSIEAEAGDVLVFSFIGFSQQKVAVANQTEINVTMREDEQALDEVVVVGYGTQKKEDVTGSVATVNEKTIKDLPVSSVDQKMIGQVAGVQIQQVSGAPGAGTSIKIRGSGSLGAGNEPLYVVDGMPYSSGMNQSLNPLAFIDPNNIESITILKDASSTAIYGSRGANGVIMITTKKGTYNQTNITFSAMAGVQQVPKKGRPNMLNQREFAQLQRDRIDLEVDLRENREATLEDYPEEYRDLDALTGRGTDWYDLILRDAPIQDYNFNLQKGTEDSRINFSLGYFNQQGVLKETGIERFSTKLGVETDLFTNLKLGVSIQPTYINQQRANTNLNREDVLGVSIWANPISTPYDENGNLKPYIVAPQSKFHSAWSFANPLYVLQEMTTEQKSFQNLGLAFLEWSILPNLRFRSSLNTILEASKYFQFVPSTVGGSNRPPTAGTGNSTNTRYNSFNWLVENTVNYDLSFGEHSFNSLLGYTIQRFNSNNINLNASPYPNDLITTINAAQAINSWGEAVNEWSMISYLGRINYSFKERYLFTATFRADGSSRFGSDNRFAIFPSLAGAWRVSEEEFFNDISWIDNLKLRVSYGKSGNNNIGNYAHLANISAGSYVFGNTQVTGSSVGISNPSLTWEESNQIDVGLDFDFFNSRAFFMIDYFKRRSNNMLLEDVIPAITGFNSQTINQGSVQNTGIEIALGGTPIAGEFSWNISGNVAFNRNEVLSLNDNTVRILSGNNDGNPTHISVVGKPIGQFFGFVLEGVYTPEYLSQPGVVNSPQVYEGNVKYKDVNGDGFINDVLDYTIIGNPHPDFIFGLTNNFSYKNFDLGVIINGQVGGQVMNGLRQTTDNLQGFFNVDRDWEQRWRSTENPGDGIHSGVPKLKPSWGHRVSTLWVEDASYLRIANLTLGYTIPSSLSEKMKVLKSSRLYFTVQNLAMFTNYKGANPEGQAANQNNTLVPGFDMTSYPLSRTMSLGINLSF